MDDQTAAPVFPPDGSIDWVTLARFEAGEGPLEERARVEAWLAASSRNAQLVRALSNTLSGIEFPATRNLDVDAALARARQRMHEAPRLVAVAPERRDSRTDRWTGWWRANAFNAAAAVVIFVGSLALWLRNEVHHHDESAGGPTASSPVAQHFATAVGQRDSVTLADGSRVTLGPLSTLTVPAGFASGRRVVELTGDARFVVRHDTAHAFEVHSGGAVITDIGTVFTVRGGTADGVHVAVREGAVSLVTSVAIGRAQLHAGDVGVVSAAGVITLRRGAATPEDEAWTDGSLVFREASLARVRDALRRWYGVELLFADSSLESRHVTATFVHDSRQQVIKVISLALGATISVRGDTVVLRAPAPTRSPK